MEASNGGQWDDEAILRSDDDTEDASQEDTQDALEQQPAEPDDINPGIVITEEERQWAKAIKEAAGQKEELRPLSDFEYAKFALCNSGGDLEAVLQKIELGQEFRDHYNLDDSVEQLMHYLEIFMDQQPGFFLHLDVNDDHQAVKVVDAGQLNPKAAKAGSGRNWKDFMCGLYTTDTICQPTLRSIRQGYTLLVDFGDVSGSNISVEVQYQFLTELCRWYPFKINQYMAFHTGFAATTRLSLVKAILPREIREKIVLGCELNDSDESGVPMERLKNFYLLPNPEASLRHLLQKARELLEVRAHNERVFRL